MKALLNPGMRCHALRVFVFSRNSLTIILVLIHSKVWISVHAVLVQV